jgi:hypothetical protein
MPSERILSMLGFMTFPAPEIAEAEQAAAASRELLDQGVDGIKLHLQRIFQVLPSPKVT